MCFLEFLLRLVPKTSAKYYATSNASPTLGQCINRLDDRLVLGTLIYQQPGSATDWSIGMAWNQFLMLDRILTNTQKLHRLRLNQKNKNHTSIMSHYSRKTDLKTVNGWRKWLWDWDTGYKNVMIRFSVTQFWPVHCPSGFNIAASSSGRYCGFCSGHVGHNICLATPDVFAMSWSTFLASRPKADSGWSWYQDTRIPMLILPLMSIPLQPDQPVKKTYEHFSF